MPYAVFRCCPTSIFLSQYESSTDAVLRRLDVDFRDIKAFSCCGYPLKNVSFRAYLLSSARNLALAEKNGVDLLTLCNCCYGSLKHAREILNGDRALQDEVNETLNKEGLIYTEGAGIWHVLEILYRKIGVHRIKEKIGKGYQPGLKVAVHYGCHLLRPSRTVGFDSAMHPSVFDELVEVTGAESISWSTKLDCCGSPVWGTYDALSMDLTEKKIKDAQKAGAHCLCVSCVYCQLQFGRVQEILLSKRPNARPLPSILYTQLLGLALGMDPKALGIHKNPHDMTSIMGFLT